jgi:hypothetical protein
MQTEIAGIFESSYSTLESKQAFVVGLLERCPMKKSSGSCPAHDLRKLPITQRIDLVMDMNDDELIQIIFHHHKCMGEKANLWQISH